MKKIYTVERFYMLETLLKWLNEEPKKEILSIAYESDWWKSDKWVVLYASYIPIPIKFNSTASNTPYQ